MTRFDRQKQDYSQCCCNIRVPVGNVESSDHVNVIGSIPAPCGCNVKESLSKVVTPQRTTRAVPLVCVNVRGHFSRGAGVTL